VPATLRPDRVGSSDDESRIPGRWGLLAPAFAPGDGVGYVSVLLRRALTDLAGAPPWTGQLGLRGHDVVPLASRARFVARVASAQIARRVDWLFFAHLGTARAQGVVPAAVRCPYAVFVHGVEAWNPALSDDRKAALRGAALRVANSDFTARRVASAHPDVGAVVACRLALLDVEPTAARGSDLDDDGGALLSRLGERVVLITGRMSSSERYKGHDELIESWPTVVTEHHDAQLVVVGGGDDVARLAEKAHAAGVGESVLFAGRVSDALLAALYARAAAFAMPSRGEGFGLVYLEAMRAGLPCIASTEDAAAEVVVHGETGLLTSQRDRAGLAAALVTLLGDRAYAGTLGRAGRARFLAEFTYDRFRERLGAILADAVGVTPGGSR
jgi:phosphatidylinositol alpha-1,6-mannosyltransferase